MDKVDEERLNERLQEIKKQGRIAPAPEGKDVPEWLKGGIQDLYDFFNSAAELWDQKFGSGSDQLYQVVAQHIPTTDAEVHALVLGCGTGFELEQFFEKAPNAIVTGIDLAPNMLKQLRAKFSSRMGQISLILGNYLDIPLGEAEYDYAISTLTVHHLPPENKLIVYKKIRTALKENGLYIEGDQSCLPKHEDHYWYHEFVSKLPGGDRAQWNYDVTLSVETNTQLLLKAGFSEVNLTWEERDENGFGRAVLVAE